MKHDFYFRHEFDFHPERWPHVRSFTLKLQSQLPGVEAWLNGQLLSNVSDPDNKRIRERKVSVGELKPGKNELVVGVAADAPAPNVWARPRPIASTRLEAELPEMPGDEELNKEALSQLALFRQLNRIPKFEELPGAIVLRRFKKKAEICREGEAGHSAFYILTSEDVFQLRKYQAQIAMGDQTPESFSDWSPSQVLAWVASLDKTEAAQHSSLRRAACRAKIVAETGPTDRKRLSAVACITQGQANGAGPENRVCIRNDGPTDLDPKTRCAQMFEGEVFGEMACMNHAPRSATVVATRKIFALEFLRNIMDSLREDAGYQEYMIETYKKRVLELHLQRTEFFRDLTGADLELIKRDVTLKRVRAGTVICHEGEEADCVYLIRLGLVQVVEGAKGLDITLEPSHVKDWKALCLELGTTDPGRLVKCPQCQNPMLLPDDSFWGRRAACPKCRHKFALENPNRESAEMQLASLGEAAPERPKPIAKRTQPLSEAEKKETQIKKAKEQKQKAEEQRAKRYQTLWKLIPEDVRFHVRRVRFFNQDLSEEGKAAILDFLNQLLRNREFVEANAIGDVVKEFEAMNPLILETDDLKVKAIQKELRRLQLEQQQIDRVLAPLAPWAGLDMSVRGRSLLYLLFPEALAEPKVTENSLRILAYRGRGDLIGEMGVVLQTGADGTSHNEQDNKRNATCIAYDHPNNNGSPSEVDLVVIPKSTFNAVLAQNATLRRRVDEIIEKRKAEMKPSSGPNDSHPFPPISQTAEYHDQGLVQGKELMLIDLECCTRCGDCVRACVRTHADGHSRLFLDGPTIGKYLVPSTCRLCRDPVCLSCCPVDAIHKGPNSQIVIENWCVGCTWCYKKCPYDSIQMHDIGLIPESSQAWQVALADRVSQKSFSNGKRRGQGWEECPAPFGWDLAFHARVKFPEDTPPKELSEKLRYGDTVLSVRLDADQTVPIPKGADEDQVRIIAMPQIAVVCDLCSDLPAKQPACVVECPHEAAFRIDGGTKFPSGEFL